VRMPRYVYLQVQNAGDSNTIGWIKLEGGARAEEVKGGA
jgi:hypothetical protein